MRFVAAYPITPATELLEWMAPALARVGGTLLQAEDELASVNMIIGASYGGVPSLTATAGPGLALMAEGIGLAVAAEVPIVVVDQPKDVQGASRVCIDDRAAMRGIAEYVVGLGHREIGLLTMRLGRHWPHGGAQSAVADPERLTSPHFHVQRERILGVCDAMTDAGLNPDALTVVETYEHLPSSGGAAADVALQANPRITALMCTADVLALSAMDHLRSRGIYVPGQMTVTGFDGVPEALARGLTTVAQPSLEKGRRAGYLLNNPPRSGIPVIEVLDTELVRGRTSGPPA